MILRDGCRKISVVGNSEEWACGHPVLGVPGAHDLSALELVDIDRLDTHRTSGCWRGEPGGLLRAGDRRADDNLVAVADHILDPDVEVGKGRTQFDERLLRRLGSRRSRGRRGDIDPSRRKQPVEQLGVALRERIYQSSTARAGAAGTAGGVSTCACAGRGAAVSSAAAIRRGRVFMTIPPQLCGSAR